MLHVCNNMYVICIKCMLVAGPHHAPYIGTNRVLFQIKYVTILKTSENFKIIHEIYQLHVHTLFVKKIYWSTEF